MSRRLTIRRFTPSIYSRGVSPVNMRNDYSLGHAEYGTYGFPGVLDLLLRKDEDEEPSVASVALSYWWVFIVSAPLIYIGIDFGLKKIGEARGTST